MNRNQACTYIIESLDDLPLDIILLIYRIISCSESGLE